MACGIISALPQLLRWPTAMTTQAIDRIGKLARAMVQTIILAPGASVPCNSQCQSSQWAIGGLHLSILCQSSWFAGYRLYVRSACACLVCGDLLQPLVAQAGA